MILENNLKVNLDLIPQNPNLFPTNAHIFPTNGHKPRQILFYHKNDLEKVFIEGFGALSSCYSRWTI
jgi:hypothetical protein